MKKSLIVILLAIFVIACDDTTSDLIREDQQENEEQAEQEQGEEEEEEEEDNEEDHEEDNSEEVTDDTEEETESDDEGAGGNENGQPGGNELEGVMKAIDAYRQSIYQLRAGSGGASRTIGSATFNDIYPKSRLVASNLNLGMDEEWLDMSVLVLDFAEAFYWASGTLDEEILFYDVLHDPGIWGWPVYDNTKVRLIHEDGMVSLRVIDEQWVQTFIFEYKQPPVLARMQSSEGLVRVFRIIERVNSGSVYIEDFLEKTGLTIWNSDGTYEMSSTLKSTDKGLYTIFFTDSEASRFLFANYVINGVPVNLFPEGNGEFSAEYDFKYVDVFDSFNGDARLFKDGEEVSVPLDMKVRPAYHGTETFVLTGSRSLISSEHSLSVPEINVSSEITVADIQANIDQMISNDDFTGITYDYSARVDVVMKDLADLMYFEY